MGMRADFKLWVEDSRTGEEIGRIELKNFKTDQLGALDKVIRKGIGKPVSIQGTGQIYVANSKIKMEYLTEGGDEIA